MATKSSSEAPSAKVSTPGLDPTTAPDPRIDVAAFRKSDEGKKLTDWALKEFERCRSAKLPKQRQWYVNMSMVFGHQWLSISNGTSASAGKLSVQPAPKHMRRKTINRLRPFVRHEHSKFLSSLPNVVAVPSTAEDEDVRAAFAGEQAWMHYATQKGFRKEYSAALWWAIMTGNGFMKTWWDQSRSVELPNGHKDYGDIQYRKVSPFNIFIPEFRENNIEDQPYVIEARVRTLDWVQNFYEEQLKDVKLKATSSSANTIMDEGYLGIQKASQGLDSVVVYEFWLKPGATKLMPQGGFFVMVDTILVDFHEGLPYGHEQFPYTKVEHMFNDTFWGDSPLIDLIPIQKELNEVRTDIGIAARRMGHPQLLAAQNSIVPGKMTNEPGSIILYRPGLPQPTPMPMAQLPSYVLEQQDRALQDLEDISGQHDISKGQAPAGITAGTALQYLGERDDNFLTPQYQGIEDAVERIARQTLLLFQEFVDIQRKIKVVGLDGAFDTLLLSGADIKNGTDVRVEPGSAVGQSQAAKQAQVMDLVSMGIIQPDQALKMLEIGGPQKVLDLVNAAERKAQRENMKMKALKDNPGQIAESDQMFAQQALEQVAPEMLAAGMPEQEIMAMVQENLPPVVPVDDFDVHEVHIETHNRFRMSQEYEALPEEVKDQFEKHVAWHQQMGGAQMQASLMAQMPPELAAGEGEQQPPGGSMAPTEDPGPATAPGPIA